MPILVSYPNKEAVPAEYIGLYTEQPDKSYKLTGVAGIREEGEFQALQAKLTKSVADHTAATAVLQNIDKMGVKVDEIPALLTEVETLRKSAQGGKTDEQIAALVDTKVRQITAPLNKQLEDLTNTNKTLVTENETIKANQVKSEIRQAVQDAAVKAGVVGTAVEDVLLRAQMCFTKTEDGKILTGENHGCTAFVSPEVWLTELKQTSPHFWPASAGGGSNGGGNGSHGTNPWAKETYNVTEQFKMISENREMAEQMAKAAGATLPSRS